MRSNKSTSPQYTLAGLWALPGTRPHAPCFRPRRQRMQRRTVIKVPSSPLLVPPTPGIPASQIAPGLDKPVSRLSARTFGLPNRIWLIVGLFGSLILFTRLVLPAHTSDASYYLRSHSSAYTSSLKPHNYLNASGTHGDNPFAFCPTFGEGDELSARYGALTVSQSWLHLGSGARIQRVLHKAMLGQPVTISVLGGSGTPFVCYLETFLDLTPEQYRHVTARGMIQ